jgi:hypothetical protein
MNQRTAILLALIGSAVLAGGSWLYFFSEEPKPRFEKLASTYQQLTVPANAGSVELSDITKRKHSADARWEFETEWDWGRYHEWVRKQLAGKFETEKKTEDEMVFLRGEAGDTYILRVEKLREGSRTRIRITFSGIAS